MRARYRVENEESGLDTSLDKDDSTALTLASSLPMMIEFATKHTSDMKLLDILATASVQKIGGLVMDKSFVKLEVISDFSLMMLYKYCLVIQAYQRHVYRMPDDM